MKTMHLKIRLHKKERERRLRKRLDFNEQLNNAEKEKANIISKFESEVPITTKLEVEWESTQFFLAHIPTLITKECNDYERFSKKVGRQIRDLQDSLVENCFWTEKQEVAVESMKFAKMQFINEGKATKDGSIRQEESLRNQLEIEETKLAYLEYSVNALPTGKPTSTSEIYPSARWTNLSLPPPQVTPPQGAAKTPAPIQNSKFAPPYSSQRTQPTQLPAVPPAPPLSRGSTVEAALGAVAVNPFSDWEDRVPVTSNSSPSAVHGTQAARQSPDRASHSAASCRSYPPSTVGARKRKDASGGALGHSRAQDDDMDVDYDFTDRIPSPQVLSSPPLHQEQQHTEEDGEFEIAISTTTTTVTEVKLLLCMRNKSFNVLCKCLIYVILKQYTMQNVRSGYTSAFLRDTPPISPASNTSPLPRTPAPSFPPAATGCHWQGDQQEYQHHRRSPRTSTATAPPPLPLHYKKGPAAAAVDRDEEAQDYEQQARMRQQHQEEVPWFREFKRRRTGPMHLSNSSGDVRSNFEGYGNAAPIHGLNTPSRHVPERGWPPTAGYGGGVGAGGRISGGAEGVFSSHGTQQSEVIDLYDASDSDEEEQENVRPTFVRNGQGHLQHAGGSGGGTAGVAFRSTQGAHNWDQRSGRNTYASDTGENRAVGAKLGERVPDAANGRRGFLTGLDIMHGTQAGRPPSYKPPPAQITTIDMIDE